MSSSNTSAVPSPSPEKKRRYLSVEKKFQIYLEAQAGDKPVGELLRREGLFSTDLARISARMARPPPRLQQRWRAGGQARRGCGWQWGGNCCKKS